jgi:D-3-phosphoglycerate dehydrogenase
MAYKVLIPKDVAEEGKEYLRKRGYEIKMGSGTSEEILCREVKDCHAVLARTERLTAEVLEAGNELKVIARHGVGVDNIDVKRAEELGIYVTNTPESNAGTVAEHTIGLILALAKNLGLYSREFRRGNFGIRNQVMGVDLEGKVLGIIGLGRIGRQVARKAHNGLDMKVIGFDPFVSRDNVPEAELTTVVTTVFEEADFITLHLPLNGETKGFMDKEKLSMMKPTAYLVNAARGKLLNEADLIDALKERRIAGAALDVFEEEPPAMDSPLFQLDNVVLTPHCASNTGECMVRMAVHAAMSIDEVLSGREPGWPVNRPKKQI